MPLFNKDYLIKARDAYQRELSHDNTILTTLGLCITDEKGLYVHMYICAYCTDLHVIRSSYLIYKVPIKI